MIHIPGEECPCQPRKVVRFRQEALTTFSKTIEWEHKRFEDVIERQEDMPEHEWRRQKEEMENRFQ